MRKKLLAILLSASMVVCLMPTMAFATEEPATTEEATPEVENVVEEPKEEVQEETPAVIEEEEVAEEVEEEAVEEVKEEATEENATLSETPSESVEEAELEEAVTGTWSGYKFKSTTENLFAIVINQDEQEEYTGGEEQYGVKISIANGVIDVTEAVNKVFETASACLVLVKYGDEVLGDATFTKIYMNVSIDKANDKDTTFTYAVDSYLNIEDTAEEPDENKVLKRSASFASRETPVGVSEFELVKDSVVINKGDLTTKDYLVIRTNAVRNNITTPLSNPKESYTVGYVFGEKSNDGNYSVSEELWATVWDRDMKIFFGSKEVEPDDLWNNYDLKYGCFSNSADLDSYIANFNALTSAEELETFYNNKFQESLTELTFSHTVLPVDDVEDADDVEDEEETVKSTKTGVQTGDSNELGLWLAFGMLASVAAAGYALKRREN